MSSEEKKTWIMAVITPVAYAAYLIVVLGRAQGLAITKIAYQRPLLATIGAAIVATIVLNIVVAIASPREAGKKDERDKTIARYGVYVGSYVLWIGTAATLLLTMAEFDRFWIANAIYLVFVLASLSASAAMIVAYRWGY